MSIKITGLKEFERKLRGLSDRAEAISGEHSVPMSELLAPSFLAGCTLFNSANELFEKSGYKIESQEDFSAIPDERWDEFIRNNTSFSSWNEMLQAASAAWARRKLGFD